MEKETERVKIRTKIGRFITLDISNKTETHIYGTDKFGKDTIIPIKDIDSMLPIEATPKVKVEVDDNERE